MGNQRMSECHPQRAHYAKGMCQSCYVVKWRSATNDQKEKHSKRERLLRKADSTGCYKRNAQKSITVTSLQPERKRRSKMLKCRYGITSDDYDRLFLEQKGVCGICKKPSAKPYLSVDHCHSTGIVRGLLCASCNMFLGKIEADKSILERIPKWINPCEIQRPPEPGNKC